MSLQNKVAIVTGASRGIGAGIATELARRGANVLITYVASADKAEQLVQEINSNQSGTGAKAACVRANCVHPDAPREVVQAAIKAFDGGIDIIVNNAGAGDEMFLKDATYEHFDKMFHTNVRFPMFLVKESLPYLRRGGRIVNVGSVVARQGGLAVISHPIPSHPLGLTYRGTVLVRKG
jgi:3-oxoacyl-[acyl-carrier protein] reductase